MKGKNRSKKKVKNDTNSNHNTFEIVKKKVIELIKSKFNVVKKSFTETNKDIKNNNRLFYSSILLDVIFFLIYGFINEAIIKLIQNNLEVLQFVLMTARGVDLRTNPHLGTLILNSQTSPYIFSIIFLSITSVISTYFLFCFFFGISNAIRVNINNFNKQKLGKYLLNFYKNSVAWFLIYVVFNLLSLYVSFTNTVRPRLNMNQNILSYILPFVGVLLSYFFITFFSYNTSKKSFKQTFSKGFKNIFLNGIIFVLVLFVFNLLLIVVVNLNMLMNYLLSLIVLVIFAVFISYFLVYFNKLNLVEQNDKS